jgi:hypothetical protein
MKNRDIKIVAEVLENMQPEQRREWFIKIKMAERLQTFASIANHHKFSTWLLAAAVNGNAPWSPRIIKALQADLKLDLAPFLTEREAAKLARSK